MSIRNKRLQKEMVECPGLTLGHNPDPSNMTAHLRGVRVELCQMYPFRPPKLFINGINAKEKLMKMRARITLQLNRYDVCLPCMCCVMLCGNDKWAPNLTVARAVDDCLEWQTLLLNLANFCAIQHLIQVDVLGQLILNFLL